MVGFFFFFIVWDRVCLLLWEFEIGVGAGYTAALDSIADILSRIQPGDVAVQLEDFVEGDGEPGYVKMYMNVLKNFQGVIKAVLEHVRDGGGEEAALFHCTGRSSLLVEYTRSGAWLTT